MTNVEALAMVKKIESFYPAWLTRKSEAEAKSVYKSWVEVLAPMGEFQAVLPLVVECMEKMPGRFPPGVFEIKKYVSRQISHAKSLVKKIEPPREDPKKGAEAARKIADMLGGIGRGVE